MSRFHSAVRMLALLGGLAVLLAAVPAQAWIETAVRSHQTTVTVLPDGRAEVRHELVLRLRGSKVKALEIPGIGGEIEVLPDATVRRARQGSSSLWPLALSLTEEDALRLAIKSERGVGGGTYRFDFGYKLDLKKRGWLEARGGDFLLTFVGPRLSTGVDSAKVLFRVPRGSLPPRLDDAEEGPAAGVLLGQIRRGAQLDEIELIRAYVAKREPAVWRVRVPRDALSGLPWRPENETAQRKLVVARRKLASSFVPLEQLGIVGLLSVLFGLLAGLKGWISIRQAQRVEARARPFLPGRPLVRGVLASLFCFGFGLLVLLHRPGWSVAAAICCLALSTHLLVVRTSRARGPGRWEQLKPEALPRAGVRGESWFEMGSFRGFLLLVLLLSGVTVGAFRLLAIDSYLSMMSIAYGLLFLPMFFTGRRGDLPRLPQEQALPLLVGLKRALDPSMTDVELWGRVPNGETIGAAVDEARIRLIPRTAPHGLRALEICLDEGPGAFLLPCVLIRVVDGSAAQAQLPSDIPWRRGRDADERVAVLRPTAPNLGQLVRLVRSLHQNLRADGAKRTSQSSRRSVASGLSAMNSTPEASMPAI